VPNRIPVGQPCKYGHPYERYPDGKCAHCVRARVRAWADRKRGGPPQVRDPARFPCGHDRVADRRSGKNSSSCARCHTAAQKRRYHADPAKHRAKAKAWAKANGYTSTEAVKRWQARNPAYGAIRRYSPDAETAEWLTIIRADPCSYCGGPMNAVDHIDPVSRGGENHWTNYAPTCKSCNSSKHNKRLLPWLLDKVVTGQ
jgi:hypothetical protein